MAGGGAWWTMITCLERDISHTRLRTMNPKNHTPASRNPRAIREREDDQAPISSDQSKIAHVALRNFSRHFSLFAFL
jgi:hypothetical protein